MATGRLPGLVVVPAIRRVVVIVARLRLEESRGDGGDGHREPPQPGGPAAVGRGQAEDREEDQREKCLERPEGRERVHGPQYNASRRYVFRTSLYVSGARSITIRTYEHTGLMSRFPSRAQSTRACTRRGASAPP